MMEGLLEDLSIVKDGRVVFDPTGTLLHFRTSELTLTPSAVFPDVPKGKLHHWEWTSDYTTIPATKYGMWELGAATITALPQEWATASVLAAVPAGCDLFVGRVKLSRTAAPSHAWTGGVAIAVLPPQDVWIPFVGSFSVLLEGALGFARALHVYISGTSLILHQQQSVSTPPGGYGLYGPNGDTVPFAVDGSGAENAYTTGPGFPVYYNGNALTTTYVLDPPTVPGPPGHPQYMRKGGSLAPDIADVTNYGSTWSLDIRGRFGCRTPS